MRVRHDAIFVSSVLFTIAFLCLIPPMWSNAQVGRDKAALAEMDAGWLLYVRLLGVFGVTSLAVIFVVLIVIWMGYVKRVRWTWFVMFIIVWV